MSNLEVLKPEVLDRSGNVEQSDHPLDPCPNCGSRPHEAPAGVRPDGKPHWSFLHCFKCGFRPGNTVGFSMDSLKREWDSFQQFLQEKGAQPTDRGLAPPQDQGEIDLLRQQIADMQADLANLRQNADVATEVPGGFKPNTAPETKTVPAAGPESTTGLASPMEPPNGGTGA